MEEGGERGRGIEVTLESTNLSSQPPEDYWLDYKFYFLEEMIISQLTLIQSLKNDKKKTKCLSESILFQQIK